jgi:hypothetical protein
MYAVMVETSTGGADRKAVFENLENNIVPMLRDLGARAAYWFDGPDPERRLSILIFDSEDTARELAGRMQVGQTPGGAPDEVKVVSVRVNEVTLSL